MKKLLLIFNFFFILYTNLNSSEPKLEEIFKGLDKPWSLSFLNEQNIIITEKNGNFVKLNLISREIQKLKHNLNVHEDGQGGLLDVLYNEGIIYASYSENRGNGKSSTSVASATFNKEKLDFKNIFRAEPPINSGYHFGSRLVIKENYIFITVGERGQGMIAQDGSKHPGSIIRINLDDRFIKNTLRF